MAVLRLIFNIAWFVLGGFVMGLAWWLAGQGEIVNIF